MHSQHLANDYGLRANVVTVELDGFRALSDTIVEGPVAIRSDEGEHSIGSEEVRSTALGGDWEHRGKRTSQ